MPAEGERLSDEEISVFRTWIDAGADWPGDGTLNADLERHWAYVRPERVPPPTVHQAGWVRQPVDTFVLRKLEEKGLSPSEAAAKERLIRRVTLDLTGLPPTLAEVRDFLAAGNPDAYERLVDRLLASPMYGERWTTPWLDAARYADSNGFQEDDERSVWPYRDWVIRAINADMGFDRFTIEQIAGDLLPGATQDQIVATGFHRGTMTNLENGIDVSEQRVLAVLDRVNTTAAVWLGTTLECAQCHDHKYDPFTQEDYYRLYGFFNSTQKEIRPGVGGYNPKLIGPMAYLSSLLSPEQQAEAQRLQERIAELERQRDEQTEEALANMPRWEKKVRSRPARLAENIVKILDTPPKERTPHESKQLEFLCLATSPELQDLRGKLQHVEQQYENLVPTSLVMQELGEPRVTRVFERGSFLNEGDEVEPGVPAVLQPLQVNERADRLALAEWLVDADNPLVARVIVNRHWNELFGRGLVETLEDFGTHGERPTHPDLLDWLATEFVRREWSTKALHRLIVTSATYRQSARVTPSLAEADPDNAFYARGPRKRLRAEAIRDQALAAAGLLSQRMYGQPVFPYQPPGIWRQVDTLSNLWKMSVGEDRYRRGLYVYWRRTSPYPSFVNFDAPSREVCTLGRTESITPMQALTLQNDPVYVEAAARLAQRLLEDLPAGASAEDRIAYGFRLLTSRIPTPAEIAVLVEVVGQAGELYHAEPAAVEAFHDEWNIPEGGNASEQAVWFQLARVLLNLDEVVMSN